MGLIADILPGLLKDLAYGPATAPGLLADQTITIKRVEGQTVDWQTGGGSGTAVLDSETLAAMSPWPYQKDGVGPDVQGGEMQTSVSGRDAAFDFPPKPGMLATLDGKTWQILHVFHDLDGDEYLLTLKGAGA